MIKSKDASKSDERQVKNTSNPLTRKRKGETYKMGERCMLKTFFVIAVMLFATMLSVTAMAADNDGKGTVTVGWNSHTVVTATDVDGILPTSFPATTPLNAGSKLNAVRFTYTAFTDVAGADADGTGIDEAGVADANDTAIDMAGGSVRIAIPAGWTVPDKVKVVDYAGTAVKDDTLYDTSDGTSATDDEKKHVTFTADKHIVVKLGDDWAKRNRTAAATIGRTLQITFYEVTTGVPSMLMDWIPSGDGGSDTAIKAYGYTFSTSSMAMGGTHIRIGSQPKVYVGNILASSGYSGTDADLVTAKLRDTLKTKVTVTPATMFQGEENHRVSISFEAPGPMYGGILLIPIPNDARPKADDADDANKLVTVSSSSGVVLGGGEDLPRFSTTFATDEITDITVNFDEINKGQKVTVSYPLATVAAVENPTLASFTRESSNNALNVRTSIDGGTNYIPVNVLEGGKIRTVRGSGTLAISPFAIEAGSKKRSITLTYTAQTALAENTVISVTPAGIATELASGNVSGASLKSGAVQWTLTSALKKDRTLKATIKNIDIVTDAREYPWEVTVGTASSDSGEGADDNKLTGDAMPTLAVTKTSQDAVKFEVVGESSFSAGSMQEIKFRFTAQGTPIRGGRVSFTIPAALGSAPADAEAVGRVIASVSGGALEKDEPTVSGRTINVAIKNMDVGDSVTVTYGSVDKKADHKALIHHVAGEVKIRGTFRSSADASTRTATGEAVITVTNVEDGTGAAVLNPTSVEAGSISGNAIEVVFTASGTMDGGKVVLERPAGWGDMQNTDPTKRNYVRTTGSGVALLDVAANQAIATIGKLAKGGSFRFLYGGGTAGDANGIDVDVDPATAQFMIKSDGDGDGVFKSISSKLKHEGREKIINPDQLGKIFAGADGILKVKVTSASDGTGTATVDVASVRAAADDVALTFTYTPSRTITDGELRFTVPASWSKPQVEEIGMPGFIEVNGLVGASIGTVTDDDKFTVIVPIFSVDKTQMIEIKYGATDTGRAMASTVVGTDAFKIEVQGHANGQPRPIRMQPTVEVKRQASGKGKAVLAVDGDALHAGDMGRKFTVTYTAAGQVVAGSVRLTVPGGWSAPVAGNVMAMAGTAALTPTFDAQMATVDGVNLMAGGQVTFTYTGDVTPDPETAPGDTSFAVAVNGGDTGDTFAAVSGEDTMLGVTVGHARAGSGAGMVSPRIVQAGATGVNIQFTYTAVGWTDFLKEFRVQVPAGWTAPSNAASSADNMGTYTVEHRSGGVIMQTSIEKLDPIGRDMVARVKRGGLEVIAGDQIIFTYENATAPAAPEISNFVLIFDQQPIADSVKVRVQDSTPSALSLESAGTVSADAGAMPLGITVGLQDSDGDAVAMSSAATITLVSTSATGAFSTMAGGTGSESLTVSIAGGDVSAMAYYTDSTAGVATISASAPGLTAASQDVTVTGGVIAITSVMVSPTVAKDGDTVTVTAMATAGQAPTATIGTLVTDGAMVESPSGTYTRSDTLAAGTQEGTYAVSVSIGDVMMAAADMLTVDNTAPMVTVTAPESAANGDTVMISAEVTEAGTVSSVTADVSMLDSTQTDMVALTMGTDGSYSASVTISDDNAAANGAKAITVTATDAAGNMGTGTASVDLANMLSYTSTISTGQTLFHVPLDVEGLDTVADLKTALGDGVSLVTVYDTVAGSWNSRSDDVAITADLGMILVTTADITHTFEGLVWGGGVSMVSLSVGSNLVGLPLDAAGITNVSDLITVSAGAISSITVSTDDGFASVAAAGDDGDGPVMGDAGYLVTATSAATVPLLGAGWSNDAAGAAPVALSGYNVGGQTAVLDVNGAVVDELTGLAREGFRVKVKNLSTKAALSEVTSVEMAEGYNMTFVDLKAGHAARIGDVLEISADSPSPLIGVQPVRHIVTVEDVKSGILALEDLIAYEIPAETELLRNYPNPFNPETWIPYRLAEDANVSLTIYDVNGELVRTIDMGHQSAAVYESRAKAIYWDGRNRFGEQVASGIYFYSLSAGDDFSATRKMVILK